MDRSVPLVEFREVSKWFGPTRSLDRVSLDVQRGEVHVLAGGNGAGKSTLIRVLSGVFTDYSGDVLVAGEVRTLHSPDDARRAGIATIHQELPLVGSLSVADNLLLGEPGAFFGRVGRRAQLERARELLQRVGLEIDPERRIETLPLGLRQLIEIARALGRDAELVIFDEPTSALPEADAERLFELIAELCGAGKGVVYISHRMEEIYRLAQRITVLRDGHVVSSRAAAELPEAELVAAMTGRELEALSANSAGRQPRVLLGVENLSAGSGEQGRREVVSGVSFELHQGEVLGVAGLQGAGTSELLHALYGDLPHSGRVLLDGAPLVAGSPEKSIAAGVMLLPSDRALSVFDHLGMIENATLSALREFSRAGIVRREQERAATGPVFERLALPSAAARRYASELSGGNRQRLALARCLLAKPRVLLLDEPTRGVDVAAKHDIYRLIRELAAEGTGVIWIASELAELLALSQRILVLSRGKTAGLIDNSGASAAEVLRTAMNRASA